MLIVAAQGIAMLEVVDVSCRKGGKDLFSPLSFHVKSGQCWVIEGRNGSGKTSLLRVLATLSQPEKGELRWYGKKIEEVEPSYKHSIMYGGHSAGVYGELSVHENVDFLLSMDGIEIEPGEYVSALKRFGLFSLRQQPVQKLSAGQQKRCFLVRLALSKRPLWILDEQLTALDQEGQQLLGELVAAHLRMQGAVVMTSHQYLPWALETQRLVLDT